MIRALLAASPVLVPVLTVVLTLLTRSRRGLQRATGFLGSALFLACGALLVRAALDGAPLAASFGGWPDPFAIRFQIDLLGAGLILVTGLIAVAVALFESAEPDDAGRPLRLPLVHGILAGVGGAFATADLFNLYVWFEVMLMSALGLLALGGEKRHLDAAFRYLVLNVLGTMMLVLGVGVVYGVTGHLAFSAIGETMTRLPPPAAAALPILLVFAFLLKAGAFPLFAWLPASYPTLPPAILALFAGLLTKVGIYALLRTTSGIVGTPTAVLSESLGWIAAATMVVGVLGAAYHYDLRRILAFHIVSQVGYILLGVALGTKEAVAAAVFYTVHHIAVKANLFLAGGIVARKAGSFDLRQVGGLWAARPLFALLFLVPALSLVGIPPLSGFWAKLAILRESVAAGRVAWTVLALLVSVFTLYSMLKFWMEAFWKPHPAGREALRPRVPAAAYVAVVLLAATTLAIGIAPEILLSFAARAAAEIVR